MENTGIEPVTFRIFVAVAVLTCEAKYFSYKVSTYSQFFVRGDRRGGGGAVDGQAAMEKYFQGSENYLEPGPEIEGKGFVFVRLFFYEP